MVLLSIVRKLGQSVNKVWENSIVECVGGNAEEVGSTPIFIPLVVIPGLPWRY
jgi:hypothetical protein